MELQTSAQLTTMSSSTIQPGHTQAFENAIEVHSQSPGTYAADLKWEWSVGSGMYEPRYKPIHNGRPLTRYIHSSEWRLHRRYSSSRSHYTLPAHASNSPPWPRRADPDAIDLHPAQRYRAGGSEREGREARLARLCHPYNHVAGWSRQGGRVYHHVGSGF